MYRAHITQCEWKHNMESNYKYGQTAIWKYGDNGIMETERDCNLRPPRDYVKWLPSPLLALRTRWRTTGCTTTKMDVSVPHCTWFDNRDSTGPIYRSDPQHAIPQIEVLGAFVSTASSWIWETSTGNDAAIQPFPNQKDLVFPALCFVILQIAESG